jgi:hypothetical protein
VNLAILSLKNNFLSNLLILLNLFFFTFLYILQIYQ